MSDGDPSDWYAHPFYYDIVFDGDTGAEADFLEAVLKSYGRPRRKRTATILEPACGTGRLVLELARRGHQVDGFDLSKPMLRYARHQKRSLPIEIQRRINLKQARMQAFRPAADHYDLAFCLLSTFKYLLTEAEARSHLRRMARALRPGGIYVLGLHLADYRRRRPDHERWIGKRDGITVTCDTDTAAADSFHRLEALTNQLTVRRRGQPGKETIKTEWNCRTYDSAELRSLIASVASFEIIACHDFLHRIDVKRTFDDSQDDIVLVLRKKAIVGGRPAPR